MTGSDIIIGTIVLILFIMIILWQIYLLMAQRTKHMEFKKDYIEFKSTIENSWKKEMDDILQQNRELIATINKLIEHKSPK